MAKSYATDKQINDTMLKLATLDNRLLKGSAIINDSYTNPLLNLGYNTSDPLNTTTYVPNNKLTWDFLQINQIERAEPLFRKIVDYKASALLKGIDIKCVDLTNEQINIIQNRLTDNYEGLYNFIYQAIFYGGGAGMILFRGDTEEDYLKPLDVSKIESDSFLGIKPLERWTGVFPDNKRIDEVGKDGIDDPTELGMPLYYKVYFGGVKSKSYKVHCSRLLIYNTGHLPYIQKQMEQFWGTSEVELLWDSYNRYITGINAVINMMIISNTRVIKMDDTDGSAQMTDRAIQRLQNKYKLMKASLNFSNILVLDKEDEYEQSSVPLNDVPNVLKQLRLDFASSAGVPPSILFPDSFENAQDDDNIHQPIKNKQRLMMKSIYYKLIKIICKNDLGIEMPKTLSISFKNIRSTTDKDQAEILDKCSRALIDVYKTGAMDTETFIRSLSEINDNVSDIFDNYKEAFIKENGKVTYTERQIELAKALNKPLDSEMEETNGGNNQELLQKPTPKVEVGELAN
jgi:phage-related protein (TIGR01555 family)